MLQARVDQEPVTADMELRKRYAFVLPETVAFRAKILPDPPALWTHQPIVARAVIGAATSLTANR